MQNLLEDLKNLLEQDERLVVEGELMKNKIIELALQLDPGLIKALLSHQSTKKHFFQEVDGVLVFDKIKFQSFISNKAFLPDSSTAFKNKIGLVNEQGDYFSESKEVVLAWPYRDCVLEGGQTKDDEKRDEVFWNETLAPDEIDTLLAPKVFTNFKKYDKGGGHPVNEITPNDNLIIKGNNLLALHSLLKVYRNRIKLIYIDPPYNTGNDDFGYNDKFNHSSWLTFMRNRLEASRDLLRRDGAIFVQIDDNEVGYLRVLMDELYGRENFICQITIERSAATGHKAINPSPVNVSDYLLVFSKNKSEWKYHHQFTKRGYDRAYNLFIDNLEKGYTSWSFRPISEVLKEKKFAIEEAIRKFPEKIARFAEPSYSGVGKETRDLIDKSKKMPDKIFCQERDGHPNIYLKSGQRILFYKDKLHEIDGEVVTADALTTIWKDIPFQGIAKEGGVVLLKGKKPEKLLRRIIEMVTENKEDIVLDFFNGSGTTSAVSHKMEHQYIGIEQLEYGKNDSVIRLKNVIKGDPTGISQSVNWKGGGSFIYCELAKANQEFIDKIKSAKTAKELKAIWKTMQEKAFISYKVDIKAFNESAESFDQLSLDDQKKFLIEVLDKNLLYVNYSEIEDKDYNISKEDKKLNDKFYSLK